MLTDTDREAVTAADREMSNTIRAALYRACPNMPSYPVGIVDPYLARHRTASTAALTAEIQRLREEREKLRLIATVNAENSESTDDARAWQAVSEVLDPAALSTPSEVSELVADESGGEGERKPRSWYIGQVDTPPNPTNGDAVREALAEADSLLRVIYDWINSTVLIPTHAATLRMIEIKGLRDKIATLAKHGGAEG